ncbi:hypothetical protein AB1N83_003055 [Pleurotus pulmonarius]
MHCAPSSEEINLACLIMSGNMTHASLVTGGPGLLLVLAVAGYSGRRWKCQETDIPICYYHLEPWIPDSGVRSVFPTTPFDSSLLLFADGARLLACNRHQLLRVYTENIFLRCNVLKVIDETLDCQSDTLLENSNSVARDHLASERTFLAYVRTSLAVVSAGVALSQMLIIQLNQHPHQRIGVFASLLGAAGISLGLAILFTGRSRYFAVQSALMDGKFPVSRVGASLIALALALLVLLTFIMIFVYQKDMVS